MAKKTKRSNLSIEERLEQALVSNENAPYALPGNWCWVKLSGVADFERGITFPASAKEFSSSSTNIPCLRTANVQEQLELNDLLYVDRSYMKDNSDKLVREDDIIMSTANSRELVGKTSFVHSLTEEMTFGGFVMAIRSKIKPQYLFYFLRLQFLNGKFMGNSTQTTNIANINSTSLGETETPVPPLDEQKRIVDRIESLFTKLDEAKEKAQEVVEGFETRKAAILHRAFSGELTAKWRERNDVPDETWQQVKLGYLLEEIKYGTSEKSDYSFNGVPVLRIPNIGEMELLFDDVKQLQRGDCLPKEYLEENDILLIRSNGSKDLVGKCALVRNLDRRYTYASFLIRLRTIEDVLAEYIVWYLNSEDARKQLFRKAKSSVGIHNINSKEIADINIRISSVEEQAEVVSLLSNLIDKEKQVRETANAVIEKIDTMKKAILARAFRGELGTNDPADESAVELLKQTI